MVKQRKVPVNDGPPPPRRVTRSRTAAASVTQPEQPKKVQDEKEPKLKKEATEKKKKNQGRPSSSRKKPPPKAAKSKRVRKTPPSCPSPTSSLYLDMPQLRKPQSPLPTESHEVRNLDPPTLVMEQSPPPAQPDSPVAGPSGGSQSFVFASRPTRNHEQIPGCTYTSTFSMQDARGLTKEMKVEMRNKFWLVLKARCGGFLRPVLTEVEDQEGFKMIFRLSAIVIKPRGKLEDVPLASATAHFQTEKATSFTFEIINTSLTDNEVTVPRLKEAAEKAFETTIIRCAGKSGRGQGQMSAKDMERFAILAGWDVNVESPGSVAP